VSLLETKGLKPVEPEGLDFYVVNIGDDTEVAAMQIVQAIRGFGYVAERDYLGRSAKAQFKSADRYQSKYVVTIGEQELADHVAKIKNMATGQQQTVKLADLYTDLPTIIDAEGDEEQ